MAFCLKKQTKQCLLQEIKNQLLKKYPELVVSTFIGEILLKAIVKRTLPPKCRIYQTIVAYFMPQGGSFFKLLTARGAFYTTQSTGLS